MKNRRRDFFEEMKYNKIYDIERKYNISQILVYILSLVFLAFTELILYEVLPLNSTTSVIFGAIVIITIIAFAFYTVFSFSKNNYFFKNGDMSSGLKNYVIASIFICIVLFVLYFSNTDGDIRNFVLTLFGGITTILAAILAAMGIHYTHSKQQKNLTDKNALMFEVSTNADIVINPDSEQGVEINLKNISENSGFFKGVYRVSGNDIYSTDLEILYCPILPNKSYKFKNIPELSYDESITIIYQDIDYNYYYILLKCENEKTYKIFDVSTCDFDFLQERIQETLDAEKKGNRQNRKHIDKKTSKIGDNEFEIKKRKEETKPVLTTQINGFDLIVNNLSELLTDTDLLTLLKNERLKISREQKVRAYMILNNQQLVSLATYKPLDRYSFVSLYGLGDKKFELYGDRFIAIIKNYISHKQ